MHNSLIKKLSFFILILWAISLAQTIIPDGSTVSGQWTVPGSPYLIEGEATIPLDSILAVMPGVEIRFKTGEDTDYLSPTFDVGLLMVKGKLLAQGAPAEPILFTRDGTEGNWGIILFDAVPDSSSLLSHCRIEYASQVQHVLNWKDYSGAISWFETNIRMENCTISNNAQNGIFCDSASPEIVNCQISDNSANGIMGTNESSPQVINCTIAGNTELGIESGYNSNLLVTNSILWANAASISENLTSNPVLSYSLIQEKTLPPGVENLGSNIYGIDPQFYKQATQNYQLRSNSFCINTGKSDTSGLHLPQQDLAGNERIVHQRIDMGALEYLNNYLRVTTPNGLESWKIGTSQQINWFSNVLNVKIDYSVNDGLSWNEIAAFTENDGVYDWLIPVENSEECRIRISDAENNLLADLSDTTFIISDKTIIPDRKYVYGNWIKELGPYIVKGEAIIPKDSMLTIQPGVEVRFTCGDNHDYQNTDFDLGLLNVQGGLIAEGTVADSIIFTREGQAGNWGMIFLNQSGTVASSIKYARIENASYCENLLDTLGYDGAISAHSSVINISHSQIRNNNRTGIHISGNSSPEIVGNLIQFNGEHGILFSKEENKPKPIISQNRTRNNAIDGIFINGAFKCTVQKNLLEYNGRYGLNNFSGFSETRVVNNQFNYNLAGINGQSFMEIVGNLFSANRQGIILDHISPQIMNNTFVNNLDAGIYCDGASPYLFNCIFSGNSSDFDFSSGDVSSPTVSFSLFQKSFMSAQVTNGGSVLLGRNPAFVSSGEHPFALLSNSLAIDAGTLENPLVTLPDQDLGGKPRVYDGNNDGNSQIDMGSYEFSDLIAGFYADTTFGEPPLLVQFTDESVGEIDSRLWYFGDGDSSSLENPVHSYTVYGHFTVRLKVSGTLGDNEKLIQDYIIIEHAPELNKPVADTTFNEDSGRHLVALMDSMFSDQDAGDSLVYSIDQPKSELGLFISGDSLFLESALNYFGQESVFISATDLYGLSVSDTFLVRILSINDPPLIDASFPDSLQFSADSSAELLIWEYVYDVESTDSTLSYSFSGTNDSLILSFDQKSGMLQLSAKDNYLGYSKWYISVQDDSGAIARDSSIVRIISPVGIAETRIGTQPVKYALGQNYPNPFNPKTTINYQLPIASFVELTIYNMLGQKVCSLVSGMQKAGFYTISWNGKNDQGILMSSGVYFYSLQAIEFLEYKKMILIQ